MNKEKVLKALKKEYDNNTENKYDAHDNNVAWGIRYVTKEMIERINKGEFDD